MGRSAVAFVELKPTATLTVEELIVHCRAALTGFKVPKGASSADRTHAQARSRSFYCALLEREGRT